MIPFLVCPTYYLLHILHSKQKYEIFTLVISLHDGIVFGVIKHINVFTPVVGDSDWFGYLSPDQFIFKQGGLQ